MKQVSLSKTNTQRQNYQGTKVKQMYIDGIGYMPVASATVPWASKVNPFVKTLFKKKLGWISEGIIPSFIS